MPNTARPSPLIALLLGLVAPLTPALASASAAPPDAADCVILLHGMGRSAWSMGKMEDRLEAAGHRVWNQDYPSTDEPVEALAAPHIEQGLAFCRDQDARPVHFVTHSLGGILVRYYLQDHVIQDLGRIVMLAPPNQGSEVADALKDNWLYQKTTGPAGQQLGTGPESLPNRLEPIDASIGVIIGRDSSDPWFSPIIPGEDDGKVAVERAKLAEMNDFLVVDAGHTFVMRNNEVIRQVLRFLETGRFDHPEAPVPPPAQQN